MVVGVLAECRGKSSCVVELSIRPRAARKGNVLFVIMIQQVGISRGEELRSRHPTLLRHLLCQLLRLLSQRIDFGAQLRQLIGPIIWRRAIRFRLSVQFRLSNEIGETLILRRKFGQLVILLLQQRIAFEQLGPGVPLDQQRGHDASPNDDARADDFEFCHSRLIITNPVIGAARAQPRDLHANDDALVLRRIYWSPLRDDPGLIHPHRARQTACGQDRPTL